MKKTLSVILLTIVGLTVDAQSIVVDQGKPENTFELGVRLGFNTSNVTNNYTEAVPNMVQAHNNWQEGLTVGALVDMNIYNCFAVQTGVFYQRRRSDYQDLLIKEGSASFEYYDGKRHANYFQIPIMASFRLKLNKYIEGQVDFGPYFAFGFGGKDKFTMYETLTNEGGGVTIVKAPVKADYFGGHGVYNSFDWGFKFGIGAMVLDHYYVGIHYDAGARNALDRSPYSATSATGINKAWNFTLGYNFALPIK